MFLPRGILNKFQFKCNIASSFPVIIQQRKTGSEEEKIVMNTLIVKMKEKATKELNRKKEEVIFDWIWFLDSFIDDFPFATMFARDLLTDIRYIDNSELEEKLKKKVIELWIDLNFNI